MPLFTKHLAAADLLTVLTLLKVNTGYELPSLCNFISLSDIYIHNLLTEYGL